MLVAFIALHAGLVAAWWRWLSPRSAGLTRSERLLCASILCVAQIVGVSLLLGWFDLLSPRPLLILVILSTAALFPLPREKRLGQKEGQAREDGQGEQKEGEGKKIKRVAAPAPPAHPFRLPLILLGLLFVPTLVLLVLRGVRVPSFGWDALRYHLVMSALMLQTHGFEFPPVHNPVITGYPKVAEIWFHWILAFFGDDRWVGLAQVPFLFIAMLATYCIARRLGAGRGASAMGALVLPCAPVVLAQTTVGYTDVILAAVLLAAVSMVAAARQTAAPVVAPTAGAALGLLLGTKFSALMFVPLLFGVFAISTYRARGRAALPGLALAAVLILFLGGDTYVRNYRLHGNPVFPYRTTILGRALPGELNDTDVYGIAETSELDPVTRVVRSWSAVGVVGHSELFGGFGFAAPFLVVVLVLALIVAVRARDAPWLELFGLFATLTILTPLNFRVRFVIYLLAFGGVCLSRLLDRAAPFWRTVLGMAMLGVAAVTCAQIWRVELAALRRGGGERPDTCRLAPKESVRPAYLWMREHAPPGSTVLAFQPPEGPFAYCLWTPTFTNRVEWVTAEWAGDFDRLAVARPSDLFFLPHRAPVYGAFLRTDPTHWRTLFADGGATIVTPASAAPSL